LLIGYYIIERVILGKLMELGMKNILENSIRVKLLALQSDEKAALTTLTVIILGIFIFAIGIQVGKWSVILLRFLGI
jgi:hypothetical protein